MSARHLARERAVQFLFQIDFNQNEDLANALKEFWTASTTPSDEQDEDEKVDEGSEDEGMRGFAEMLIRAVIEHREDLDAKIQEYAKNWDLDRMGAVDRNVLRLAMYEIFYRNDIPPVVSVNEALELARELSSEESAKFVNGIVDRALKDIDRPLRSPQGK